MKYPEGMLAAARADTEQLGCQELRGAAAVRGVPAMAGSTLLLVNALCPYAETLRLGLALALQHGAARPTRLFSVFAGQDPAASDALGELLGTTNLSSPSVLLWRDGTLVAGLTRAEIAGQSPCDLAMRLINLLAAAKPAAT